MSSQKATKAIVKTPLKLAKLGAEAPRPTSLKTKPLAKKSGGRMRGTIGKVASLKTATREPPAALVAEVAPPVVVQKARVQPLSDEAIAKAFREDSSLDRRIIEGMLADREVFLAAIENEGFTTAVILRRAAELGLSEALIRQVKGVAADLAGERPGRRPAPASLAPRTCLACDRTFLSSGKGNRLCMRCRGGDAGLAQL